MTGITGVPAYGRDYTNKVAVLNDWHSGKDFKDSVSGKYFNIDTAREFNLTVTLRYDRLRKSVLVKNNA